MSTVNRDPREEPRKGDILRFPNQLRDHGIARVTEVDVSLYGYDRGPYIPMAYCSRRDWPFLVMDAKVIHVADDAPRRLRGKKRSEEKKPQVSCPAPVSNREHTR